MRAIEPVPFTLRFAPPIVLGGRRPARLVERNILSYRRMWPAFVSGAFEPIFFLLSLGLGLGELVGQVSGPDGSVMSYEAFAAPGLLAAAAMNGAIIDATFGMFYKLKYGKTYEAVLATPMRITDVAYGEVSWSLLRGTIYSGVFILVMVLLGAASSPWVVLALPACVLISFAFASVGMVGTTFMRGWQDFDFVQLAMLPLFLFSTTFYPLSIYPRAMQLIVECTPLYHAVELVRGLSVGALTWSALGHTMYLAAMAVGGITLARRRLGMLLVK